MIGYAKHGWLARQLALAALELQQAPEWIREVAERKKWEPIVMLPLWTAWQYPMYLGYYGA